ncbi:unnamed protein product [Mytilus coruscus]|uniref:Uncharacterized protein n=1 Tax=Mytilus coruscus TaxID=42192 RepID=A0A6J8F011_MYTCO|nr:unnamed protein product [Mytilus coruscus]
MDMDATKTTRNRSKKFESSEITLITELVQQNISLLSDKFKSSHGTSSVTSEKNVWSGTAHYRKGQLFRCVPQINQKIKTKWSNLHQEAKRHTQKRPVTTTELAVVHHQTLVRDARKDCRHLQRLPQFYWVAEVESPIDATNSSLATTGHDAVEIVGTPQSMSLLSKCVDQFQEGSADSVPASNPGPSSVSEVRVPAASTEDVQIIGVHLTSEKSKTAKRKIKPDDVTRMQYEVLIEQKKKLIQQTKYYELMNKKLKIHLDIED